MQNTEKLSDALCLGAHQRQRGGRGGSLKSNGEKHDVLFGIEAGQLQRVGGRIHDANIHAAGLVLERAALGPGNAHHVAEGGEDYIRMLRDGQAIVDASHGQHADRTAGPVDQFDIFRKNVFEAEAIDGVRVAAADFHEAVMPVATGQTADFLGRLRNQFGFAKLINKSHADPPRGCLAGWTRAGVNSSRRRRF